jgi:hypothetical protein
MNSITVNVSDQSVSLGVNDVICGKGRGTHEKRPANKLYRTLINAKKDSYNDSSMIDRTNIIGEIRHFIEEKVGRFVQPVQGSFMDDSEEKFLVLSADKVRKKISDDLRREIRRRRAKVTNNVVTSAQLNSMRKKKMKTTENLRDAVHKSIKISGRDSVFKSFAEPKETDVLFGPGAPGRGHPGNKILHQLMKLNLEIHSILKKGSRSEISSRVLQGIRTQKGGGRFLEINSKNGLWSELSDESALDRIARALSNIKHQRSEKNHSVGQGVIV